MEMMANEDDDFDDGWKDNTSYKDVSCFQDSMCLLGKAPAQGTQLFRCRSLLDGLLIQALPHTRAHTEFNLIGVGSPQKYKSAVLIVFNFFNNSSSDNTQEEAQSKRPNEYEFSDNTDFPR